jgi:hypothetical protein
MAVHRDRVQDVGDDGGLERGLLIKAVDWLELVGVSSGKIRDVGGRNLDRVPR